ncbi:MAG: hypothetical protein KDC26_12505 [Armatimonadetes bacterium]|nr:hypothetical protein [Armatimonadota bacterium]
MPKGIEKTKAALKLRTSPREGALTLRMGVKKHVLPFEVRMIESDDFVFVHIPPAAEIFKKDGKEIVLVTSDKDAEAAAKTLRRSRRRGRKSSKAVEMPDDVAAALAKIPAGFKLGYDADGTPRLVKTRKRRK